MQDRCQIGGAVGWLNSAPLDRKSLRGKVVMIDFWTYSCVNCLRVALRQGGEFHLSGNGGGLNGSMQHHLI
jgi:thiol-disulfide isomerase/thioredoxin